tara:strand:- start:24129 stop:24512 length:384 start_codon:yes stop_codon:yes gene_type:complete
LGERKHGIRREFSFKEKQYPYASWEQHHRRFKRSEEVETRLRQRSNQVLSWMQPGLIYPAPSQCAINIFEISEAVGRVSGKSSVGINFRFGERRVSWVSDQSMQYRIEQIGSSLPSQCSSLGVDFAD